MIAILSVMSKFGQQGKNIGIQGSHNLLYVSTFQGDLSIGDISPPKQLL